MSDIRKHGFETTQQWEEHLQEIEEHLSEAEEQRMAQRFERDLDAIRLEVAAMRRALDARRVRARNSGLPPLGAAFMAAVAAGIAALASELKVRSRV